MMSRTCVHTAIITLNNSEEVHCTRLSDPVVLPEQPQDLWVSLFRCDSLCHESGRIVEPEFVVASPARPCPDSFPEREERKA
jgi:hypothetical protein